MRPFPLLALVLSVGLPIVLRAQAPAGESPERVAEGRDFFERRVRPLLAQRCYECHAAERAEEQGAGLALDTPAGIRRGAERGPLFRAGEPRESLLLRAVRYELDDLQMPPDKRLSAAEVAVLEEWIRIGAPLPESGDGELPQPARAGIDYAAGREFWSVRPLAPPATPSLAGDTWCRGPVDVWLLQALRGRGLEPSPPADRSVWLRRVSLDLIGLPPDEWELAEFLADESPDAESRAVDRLLASPRYGERWARFWLDVARYADSTDSWLNSVSQGWLYRDWVVDAWNRDLPFDQQLRLQLAADLLPDTPPQELAALGLIGLSPTYWKELKLSPEMIAKVVAEEWDERIDMVSRGFLGLSVACARCHDHKFDPVSMEDYYALAGVFASTQLEDLPLLPADRAAAVRTARAEAARLQQQLDVKPSPMGEERTRIESQLAAAKASPDFASPWAHGVREASLYVLPAGADLTRLEYREGTPRDLPVFLRGEPAHEGPVMRRRFLALFHEGPPPPYTQGSGRAELAESLLAAARPLVARVIVNRLWGQHFGAGIVRTPSDFGHQGEPPTHPELLERLAAELIRHDWSCKQLHRELVLSAAFRQSSTWRSDAFTVDPDNRLLWRIAPRRLGVEAWRDSLLAATLGIDTAMGGPPGAWDDAAFARRSVYCQVARRDLHPLPRLFDFPDPNQHSPARERTTTPLQQLYVLNGALPSRAAEALASRARQATADSAGRVEFLYRRLFGRSPTPRELDLGLAFVTASSGTGNPTQPLDDTALAARWIDYVQSLLGLNEGMYVE